eukprot:scaffold7375_cov268-Pinguiococcus_pyrenoidosus.AAC.30
MMRMLRPFPCMSASGLGIEATVDEGRRFEKRSARETATYRYMQTNPQSQRPRHLFRNMRTPHVTCMATMEMRGDSSPLYIA